MKKRNKFKRKICGVILAAGEGDRIKPLSFNIPKPLLSVCNKPIMQHQLENMIDLGIRDYIFVVGHLKRKIQEYFGDGSSRGVNIRYVEQKEKLGIAHAVGQLENYIDSPFMLFLGDIFIIPKHLDRMVRIIYDKNAAAVLAVKKEGNHELVKKNFIVILRGHSHRIKRVIEKPRYFSTNLKGCGVYFFDQVIFDAIRNTPRTAMRDEYEITTAIQMLIDGGFPVFAAKVVEWDMNVTVPQDLLLCNQKWLKHSGQKNIVSKTAKIAADTKLINCVIGNNVEIQKPIKIKNCVILDESKLKTERDLYNRLISPYLTIDVNGDCSKKR